MIITDTKLEINLTAKQLGAYNSPKKIIGACAGIQSGKSLTAILWLSKQVALDHETNNFIVCAPSYRHLNQSVADWLRIIFKGYEWRRQDNEIVLRGGGRIYMRSMDNEKSIEGIPKCKAIVADECGLLSYQSWVNILGRSSPLEAPVFLSSTPYSKNWYYDLFLDWKKGLLSDVDFYTWSSIECPSFPPAELDRQRALLRPEDFRRKYEASFESPGGLVYPDWSREYVPDPITLDTDKYICYAGMDLGYADPTSIIIAMLKIDGSELRAVHEHYQSYMSIPDTVAVMRDLTKRYNVTQFFVDSAHPQQINELSSARLPVTAVVKGPDSVSHGILKVTEIIRQKKLKVNSNCRYLLDEFQTYSYPEPGSPDMDKPVHRNCHSLDALRYLVMSISADLNPPPPKPPETHLDRVLARIRNEQNYDWYNL